MSKNRRFALILALTLLLLSVLGMATTGFPVYSDGPYRGQLLDAETRQPLEGAVVLFYWERDVYGGPGGPVGYFLNAKEVLTDKEGRFYISWFIGSSLNPFSVVQKPKSIFYYPGYGSEFVEVTPPDGEPFRDPTVVPMRKLRTRKGRIREVGALPPGIVPDEAMPNLIRLMNVEGAELGLEPVHVPGGGRR